MAFEALTDLETKLEALQILVEKEILTKHDFDLCARALKRKNTEKGLIYRDKLIAVYYRGLEEQQMLAGKGVKVYLVIENRTNEPITVKARKSVNGIIVEKDDTISNHLPEKAKVIETPAFFFEKLKAVDVESIRDIQELSFLFRYEDDHFREIGKAKKPSVIQINS